MPPWRPLGPRPALPRVPMRLHRARVNGALCAVLAAAAALFLTANGPAWFIATAMLGAAVAFGGAVFGLVMVGPDLRAHGVGAGVSAVFAATVAFAGAYTAGEPLLSVAIAVAIAASGAFLSALIVLSVIGRRDGVRRKKKSDSAENRPE